LSNSSDRPLALVTGASAGIGATFAYVLSAIGLDPILVARRRERLEALREDLEAQYGVEAETLVADLATPEGLRAVEQRIRDARRLDLLVNNAGFGTTGRFWECDLERQEQMHQLHVTATLRLTHAALCGMVARKRGAIINVASVAGFAPTGGSVSYGATKAWMIAFTEALHMELRNAGSPVRVQALCPGFTYSEFHDVLGVDRSGIPEPLWMQPEDVVAESMRGLRANQPVVVPGKFYRALVALLRILPRQWYYQASAAYARRSRRELDEEPAVEPAAI
jgi:short-subunit dehydrogenase